MCAVSPAWPGSYLVAVRYDSRPESLVSNRRVNIIYESCGGHDITGHLPVLPTRGGIIEQCQHKPSNELTASQSDRLTNSQYAGPSGGQSNHSNLEWWRVYSRQSSVIPQS